VGNGVDEASLGVRTRLHLKRPTALAQLVRLDLLAHLESPHHRQQRHHLAMLGWQRPLQLDTLAGLARLENLSARLGMGVINIAELRMGTAASWHAPSAFDQRARGAVLRCLVQLLRCIGPAVLGRAARHTSCLGRGRPFLRQVRCTILIRRQRHRQTLALGVVSVDEVT